MKLSTKFVVACLVFALCGGSWYAFESQKTSSSAGTAADSSGVTGGEGEQVADADNAMNNALGLALQGISLFQGNKGSELWRLKATWAHLSQSGDVINVDRPVVRYLLGEPGTDDFLDVVSEKGQVTDNQRYLTLWGDVRLTRFDEVVTGSRLKYDAATRVMVFPEGAALDGPSASGTAMLFTWNLENNVMVGENGVEVVLKPRSNVPSTGEAPDSAATANPNPVSVSGEPKDATSAVPVVKNVQQKAAQKPAVSKKSVSQKKAAQKKTPPKKPQSKNTGVSKKQPATQPRN